MSNLKKIIGVDNANRDEVSDIVVCDNVMEYFADHIANSLNERYSADHASRFFVVRDNDYIPHTFEGY